MGRGQAGAPKDDDHVPWSRPPWHGHRAVGRSWRWPVRAWLGRIPEQERAEARPGSGPEGKQGRAGAKQPEAAEGFEKFCQRSQWFVSIKLVEGLTPKKFKTQYKKSILKIKESGWIGLGPVPASYKR